MKIFFVSDSIVSIRDEAGNKTGVKFDTANGFRDKILPLLKNAKNIVFVCNESKYVEDNENSAKVVFEEMRNLGLPVENYVVLDNRNKSQARELLQNADYVQLQGGIILEQLKFLKEINFVDIMKDSDAVVLGKSAGAMNMQSRIYNYPETNEDIGLEKWLDGMGYSKYSIIPHFNVEIGNEYCFGDFDVLNDYYIPDSMGEVLYGIPNGSYIYLEDGVFTCYGEAYTISDGIITKICENEKSIILE